ncbi:hypothetical protein DSM25559_4875 [Agrobacterium rosae]|uniref:Uncharacterized protein n=1 Tax=Agrobacterium rosae TaxID=1972867 RepID=A0A1R3U1T1_9HYPH|nr:hypothetical protein DSM25559_4875 [Agrobacterium rosae]
MRRSHKNCCPVRKYALVHLYDVLSVSGRCKVRDRVLPKSWRINEHVNCTATGEDVVASATIQRIGTSPSDNDVIERVARAGKCSRTRTGQVLHIGAERMARECCANGVDTLIHILHNNITGIVDHIGVIARTTDQRVRSRTAIQRVIARASLDRVGGRVTVPVKAAAREVRFSTFVASQRIGAKRGADLVVPASPPR